VRDAEIPRCLATGCWRMLPATAAGYPVVWHRQHRWRPDTYDCDEYAAYVHRFCQRLSASGPRYVIVADLDGWTYGHLTHLRKAATLGHVLNAHNPDMLHRCVVFGFPAALTPAWNVISALLPAETVARIRFLPETADRATQKAELVACGLDDAAIPGPYGGALRDDGDADA
jgi:hypothetical protein